MKNKLIAVLTILIVGFFVLSANASTTSVGIEKLPVYDEQGNPVSSQIATAEGRSPSTISLGKTQKIRFNAKISSSLAVKLSSTVINWNIKKAGTYQTRAIEISTGTYNNPTIMTVHGTEDLKAPGFRPVGGVNDLKGGSPSYPIPTSISTFYALQDLNIHYLSNDTKTSPNYNIPHNYIRAKQFNGAHKLRGNYVELWNKLTVPPNIPAGNYMNEFTVTFSQPL